MYSNPYSLSPRPPPAGSQVSGLQLSGHAHRGQIILFNLLTGLWSPMQDGLYYILVAGQRLYTSRGTGTWGLPMRILPPPEITLIEIVLSNGGPRPFLKYLQPGLVFRSGCWRWIRERGSMGRPGLFALRIASQTGWVQQVSI